MENNCDWTFVRMNCLTILSFWCPCQVGLVRPVHRWVFWLTRGSRTKCTDKASAPCWPSNLVRSSKRNPCEDAGMFPCSPGCNRCWDRWYYPSATTTARNRPSRLQKKFRKNIKKWHGAAALQFSWSMLLLRFPKRKNAIRALYWTEINSQTHNRKMNTPTTSRQEEHECSSRHLWLSHAECHWAATFRARSKCWSFVRVLKRLQTGFILFCRKIFFNLPVLKISLRPEFFIIFLNCWRMSSERLCDLERTLTFVRRSGLKGAFLWWSSVC